MFMSSGVSNVGPEFLESMSLFRSEESERENAALNVSGE